MTHSAHLAHSDPDLAVLATLLPVAAILSIISVCCIVYCCRKYRKRSNISKGFRNMSQFGPPTLGAGTLDRKAMLGQETSSENSDHFRGNPYEGSGPTSVSDGKRARAILPDEHVSRRWIPTAMARRQDAIEERTWIAAWDPA